MRNGTILLTILLLLAGMFVSPVAHAHKWGHHGTRADYLSDYPDRVTSNRGRYVEKRTSGNRHYDLDIGSDARYTRNFGKYFVDRPHKKQYRKRAEQHKKAIKAAAKAGPVLPTCGNFIRASKYRC